MKKAPTPFQILPDFFDVYLTQTKGLSENTANSYKYAFQLLYEFLYDVKKLRPQSVAFSDLEGGTVDEFLLWIETNRNCSAATRNQRKAAIATFAKYAVKKNFAVAMNFGNEVSNINTKRTQPSQFSYFTTEEIAIILSLSKGGGDTERRNKAILSFLYGSGARAQELCDLTVNDIRFGKNTSVRLTGKGNKSRVVVIPERCAALLQDHLHRNRIDERESRGRYAFSSHTHAHMTISCVEAIVSKYVRLAKAQYPDLFNEKRYSPHSFRHSIAVHMLEAGVPLPVIKVFLGHSSIETTMVYATVSDALKDFYLKNRNVANDVMNSIEITAQKHYSIKEELSFLKQK
jgi:integrase/recombinase XerD